MRRAGMLGLWRWHIFQEESQKLFFLVPVTTGTPHGAWVPSAGSVMDESGVLGWRYDLDEVSGGLITCRWDTQGYRRGPRGSEMSSPVLVCI